MSTVDVRVELPAHLRTLARVGREVVLLVEAPPTLRGVMDALEAGYPMLRGTVRDPATGGRRAYLRIFACEQDLSHEDVHALLPEAVARGEEPLLVVGAVAGG